MSLPIDDDDKRGNQNQDDAVVSGTTSESLDTPKPKPLGKSWRRRAQVAGSHAAHFERRDVLGISNMPKPTQQTLPDYAVRFVGYSAKVIARKGNVDYAELDFVIELTTLWADEGRVLVSKRSDLSSAVADLPSCIDELKSLVKSPMNDGHRVEMRRGEAEISIRRAADVDRFVSQITERYHEVEPILEQAEKIGSGIKRVPYEDYIEELGRTGLARVSYYGDAFFIDGKLLYRPEFRTVLVKPGKDGRTFLISPSQEQCLADVPATTRYPSGH
jgi:hypothetical protein